MGENFGKCLEFKTAKSDVLKNFSPECTFEELHKLAIDFSDGFIVSSPTANKNLKTYATEKNIPVLDAAEGIDADAYIDFFDKAWSAGKEE